MKHDDILFDETLNFSRIAEAIEYIQSNFQKQPSLDEIADHVHLSPFHFQRIFTEWAGTSPKKFLQYISIEHAKKLLKDQKLSLSETSEETGFSSTSRLHDLFVNIEGMSPAEFKNGGKSLSINYNFFQSPFGKLLVASTSKGICHMAFIEDEISGFSNLKSNFPNAKYSINTDTFQESAIAVVKNITEENESINLHIRGTDFQMKVWESLLKIPSGNLTTYGNVAHSIGNPNASRAVGTAIGSNPVAFLIPCHRVIQSTGVFGGYMWGKTRKTAIIGWECSKDNE